MLQFGLDTLLSKELFKDVLVRLVNGEELTLNYFELMSEDVAIPFHEHPVEHLVVVLEGKVEFLFKSQKLSLDKGDGLFLPARTPHSARAICAPVRALEIYIVAEDPYYEK
jgi:quercetin dioxygenase-like cupin family protein